jgi:hypothetical protein
MTDCICLRETNALLGETIDVWRVVEFTTITADVRPPQVIDEKEDDIRGAITVCRLFLSASGVAGPQEEDINENEVQACK